MSRQHTHAVLVLRHEKIVQVKRVLRVQITPDVTLPAIRAAALGGAVPILHAFPRRSKIHSDIDRERRAPQGRGGLFKKLCATMALRNRPDIEHRTDNIIVPSQSRGSSDRLPGALIQNVGRWFENHVGINKRAPAKTGSAHHVQARMLLHIEKAVVPGRAKVATPGAGFAGELPGTVTSPAFEQCDRAGPATTQTRRHDCPAKSTADNQRLQHGPAC